MIIGKAIYAGGSGGLKPEIIATAEAGSTLTCGAQSYILGASETTHTFTVALGTHIVTATKGSDSATKTVLVDMVAQYEVSLAYGTPLADISVGSIVKLNVNGTAKNFIVVHQGNPNSSIYSTTYNGGTILLMQDIYENKEWHSSDASDYEYCTLHSYLNNGFLALFDANIQSVIKQVKVPYRKGPYTSKTVTSGENGLSCKIFLLSGAEVGFTSSDASYLPTNEGAKLSYFESGTGSSAKNKRIAKLNGSATLWWLRSPNCSTSGFTCGIDNQGVAFYSFCSRPYGVRPALVLPDTTLVDDNGMITV